MLMILIGCSDYVFQEADGVSPSDNTVDTCTEDHSDDEDKENEPEGEQEEEDEDDGGGWITPSNIRQVKMESGHWTAPADVKVGCLTTDFAMQVTSGHMEAAAHLYINSVVQQKILHLAFSAPPRMSSSRSACMFCL